MVTLNTKKKKNKSNKCVFLFSTTNISRDGTLCHFSFALCSIPKWSTTFYCLCYILFNKFFFHSRFTCFIPIDNPWIKIRMNEEWRIEMELTLLNFSNEHTLNSSVTVIWIQIQNDYCLTVYCFILCHKWNSMHPEFYVCMCVALMKTKKKPNKWFFFVIFILFLRTKNKKKRNFKPFELHNITYLLYSLRYNLHDYEIVYKIKNIINLFRLTAIPLQNNCLNFFFSFCPDVSTSLICFWLLYC